MSTFVAVILGSLLNKQNVVPLSAVRACAGILFVIFGILLLYSVFRDTGEKEATVPRESGGRSGILAPVVFRAAEVFERSSMEFYRNAAESVNGMSKEIFLRIMEDEKRHLEMLRHLNSSDNSGLKFSTELNIPGKLEIPVWERNKYRELIEHEERAAFFYEALAAHAPLRNVKKAFIELAEEERKHIGMLKKLFAM
jgi:rubrerythrin